MSCFNLTKLRVFITLHCILCKNGVVLSVLLTSCSQAHICTFICVCRNGNFMERPIDCLILKLSLSTMLLMFSTLSPPFDLFAVLNILSFRVQSIWGARGIPTSKKQKYTDTLRLIVCVHEKKNQRSRQIIQKIKQHLYRKFRSVRIHQLPLILICVCVCVCVCAC